MEGHSWFAVAAGVASHDPDPIALVGGSNVTRSKHAPPRIKPHRGQVSENDSEPPRSERWGVLHEDEAGSHLANDPRHLPPQARSGSGDPFLPSGAADILTGEPA